MTEIQNDFRYYLAYGSNMNHQQMRERCPKAQFEKVVLLLDFELVINSLGDANILPKKGESVEAVIWRLTNDCETKLDIYEDVESDIYLKQYMDVADLQNVLIYIATDRSKGHKPKDYYLNKIISGAIFHKFTAQYIKKIESLRFE